MKKLVSIIIVNWNAKKFTEDCLNSIKEKTDYYPYEIILIDNNSVDGSKEAIRSMKKKGFLDEVIFNDENKGFAYANNQGFDIAKGEVLFMLNNDVLLEKKWLTHIVEVLKKDERIAAAGSRLIGFEEPKETRAWNGNKEKLTLCGAAMAIKKEALTKIGYLDVDNFSPAYGEETDWCFRARNAGFKLVEVSDSVVRHYGSGSTLKQLTKPNQYVLMNTNRLKAMLLNLSIFDMLRFVPGLGLIALNSIKNGMFFYLLKSYLNNIKKLKWIIKERKKRRKKYMNLKKTIWN